MARKEIYKNKTISFYEDEIEIYEKLQDLANRNKQSIRSAIMIAVEGYFANESVSDNTEEKQVENQFVSIDPIIDPETKRLFD